MKKFLNYYFFLTLFLFFIGTMGFGAIVKYHYDGGKKFKFLQKPVMFIASVPLNARLMIKHRTFNLDKVQSLFKHKNKTKKKFVSLVLSSYIITKLCFVVLF